jgi:membrane protein YqaA with SNARE-associated domain
VRLSDPMPEQQPAQPAAPPPAEVSVGRWFVLFALYLAAMALPVALLLDDAGGSWKQLFLEPGKHTAPLDQGLKLLIFALYLSLCCTFIPLPTSWMVAAIATRQVALTGELWSTVLLVGLVGAAASTMANLNDYHLFTLLLRHRRIAPVRDSRVGRRAIEWFNKAPFTLLVIFNIVPIPVDVARMVAATGRYPRLPFAAANFVGRFIRCVILAGVCFLAGVGTLKATLIMLGLATVLALGRVLPPAIRKILLRTKAGHKGHEEHQEKT